MAPLVAAAEAAAVGVSLRLSNTRALPRQRVDSQCEGFPRFCYFDSRFPCHSW